MNLKLTALIGSLLMGSVAFAAPTLVTFNSLGSNATTGGAIEFSGNTMSFPGYTGSPGTGETFKVSGCTGCVTEPTFDTFLGSITGTYTIGAITNPFPGEQYATVTGTGQFIISDGTNNFTANLTWDNITSLGVFNGLNLAGEVNVSGATYSGTNADLQALAALAQGIAVLDFTFTSAKTLSSLTAGPAVYDGFSGQYSPVPEPTFYGLLGLGVAGAIWLNQRKKKTVTA